MGMDLMDRLLGPFAQPALVEGAFRISFHFDDVTVVDGYLDATGTPAQEAQTAFDFQDQIPPGFDVVTTCNISIIDYEKVAETLQNSDKLGKRSTTGKEWPTGKLDTSAHSVPAQLG